MTEIEIFIRGDEKSSYVVQGGLFGEGIDVLKKNSVYINGNSITIEVWVDDHLVKRIDFDEKGEES